MLIGKLNLGGIMLIYYPDSELGVLIECTFVSLPLKTGENCF